MKFLTIFLLLLSFNSNAAYCLKARSNGNLYQDSVSVEDCPSGLILLSKTDYDLSFQADVVTATEIGLSFLWGFGTYIGFWFMGYAIRVSRNTIKQV